jgi:predicted DNA-binding WGR domain protein
MYPWTNLELIAGTAKKFWGARVCPRALHLTWGRTGTAGQSTWHKFPALHLSTALAEELVAAKLRAGYRRARWCPPDFED